MERPELQPQTSGLSAVARVVTAITVFVLAVLTVLMVLDIVPRDVFADISVKIALVAAITIVTALAIGLLLRR